MLRFKSRVKTPRFSTQDTHEDISFSDVNDSKKNVNIFIFENTVMAKRAKTIVLINKQGS